MSILNYEESDQAGCIGDIFSLHVQQRHGGVTNENCPFCKNFIIPPLNQEGLVSYEL